MKIWVKTYVIVALCLIGAGMIYLCLPFEQNQQENQKNQERLTQEKEQAVSDAKWTDDRILYRIEEGQIETGAGWLSLADEVQWKEGDQVIEKGRGRFLGKQVTIEQNQEGKVTAITTAEDLTAPSHMRVVLSNGAGGYCHKTVTVTCEEAFWGIWDGMIRAYPPGAEINIESLKRRAVFYPAQEGTALTLTNDKGTTNYKGILEITAEAAGGYSIVNEIGVEKYLMGVVPSEMPGSYGVEAAKVQAVCARSYAYSHWASSDEYLCWGAQVDDSTQSQVYGGSTEYGASSQGVEATWGQVLTYEGNLISTNYFSTSCGYTANGQEVWSGGGAQPYQQGQPQYTEGDYGDLSEEEAFHQFITDQQVQAYDSHSPWFRWTVEMDMEQLRSNVDKYFSEAKEVKEVQEDELIETTVSEIGALEDLFIYERSQTGMAKSLLLMGSEKTVVVEGQQNIRLLLGNGEPILANGENAGVRELLPSAFISLEKIKDTEETLVSLKICGGGYGHGVGMSQNGVKGMVDAGYTYREILAHYYTGTELVNF